MVDVLEIRERTDEPIDEIQKFYESVGYGGGINTTDKIILTYMNKELIGSVRIALEEGYPVRRGMFMAENQRGKGLGKQILKKIESYLASIEKPCHCVPHSHLENFYGQIGFKKFEITKAPSFISSRIVGYMDAGHEVIYMRRSN